MYTDAIINIVSLFILFCIICSINRIVNCKYWIDFSNTGMEFFFLGITLPVFNYIVLGLWVCVDKTFSIRISTLEIHTNIVFLLLYSLVYLAVAIFEETLFRGLVLQQLIKKFPITVSIIIQALIFGVIHYRYYQNPENLWVKILSAIIIAITLGVITLDTKSLMFAIGAHFAYNLGSKILFDNTYKFNSLIYFEENQLSIKPEQFILDIEYKILIIQAIVLILIIILSKMDIKNKRFNKNNLTIEKCNK